MNDYAAPDMKYGDLSEKQLKTDFNLHDLSAKVNPYTLTKITSYNQFDVMSYALGGNDGRQVKEEKVTRQGCANVLFDELREQSKQFSFYGPYQHLIVKMINHMQKGNGTSFKDISLDSALKEQILGDKSRGSSLLRIKEALSHYHKVLTR